MRIWIKRIGVACLIPIALVLLISILLYIPLVQDFAVKKATGYAEKATGMRIGIEKIRLSFPLDLTIQGVQAINPPTDTLVSLKSLSVRINPLPLLKKQVQVDAIDLRGVRMNTGAFIKGVEIKGALSRLHVKADKIDLADEQAVLNTVELNDAAVTLLLNDTTPPDTTSTLVKWIIQLDKVALDRVAFALQMPADSLRLTTFVDKASLSDGLVDLGIQRYKARRFDISGSSFGYDANYTVPMEGLDFSHISLSDLNASIRSIVYGGKDIQAQIREFMVRERSGLAIDSLAGNIQSDHSAIHIPDLSLRTPTSVIRLTANIPWSTLDKEAEGDMRVSLDASLSKEDLLIAAGNLPKSLKAAYPDKAVQVTAGVEGNLYAMRIQHCEAELPGAFRIKATGAMEAVTDPIRRSGEISLQAESGNLDFLLATLPSAQREQFKIPAGIRLKGNATLANREYRTELVMTQDKGKIALSGRYNPVQLTYEASLEVDSLEPTHFMPKDSLYWLTASFKAEGKGTDPFAEKTKAKLEGKISDIRYGVTSVSDVTLDASLEEHLLKAELLSRYPLAKMDVTLNATLKPKDVKAMLIADVEHFDPYGMHLMKDPFSTSFQIFAEAESNLDEHNKLDMTLGNWEIVTPKQTVHPKTLTFYARTEADTTRLSFHTGDLGIVLTGSECVHDITNKLSLVSKDIGQQLEKDSTIQLYNLRHLLPDMYLEVRAGQDNPIYNYLQTYYVGFKNIAMNAYTSPQTGFRMDAAMYGLERDTMQLDTIRAEIYQDSLGLIYEAEVIKNKYRQQQPFTAGVNGQLRYDFADARFYYKNGQGETGLSIGIRADKIAEGVRFHLFPENPIIAFRPFKLNKDNYVVVRNLKDIAANLRLSGDENASFWIHSKADDAGMEEVHAELNQIDLDVISSAFSYLPPMKGMLGADFQYAPSDSSFTVVADMNVDELYYEHERVGQMMFNAVYLPLEKGNHQVDMHLFRDQQEITAITALYQMGEEDHIDGSIELMHLPLAMVNPFVPDDMVKLSGDLDGHLTISGRSNAPKATGFLMLDSVAAYVGAVGSTFHFDKKQIEIKENQIFFDRYNILAYGKNPFVIDGTIDFTDLSRMTADLKMTTNNMELLNTKKNPESLAYGKLLVNLNSTLQGPLNALHMRGNLQLLGGTNVTYVLKDSPLTVQDRMSDMVTFVSFADTVRRKTPQKPPLPLGGLDLLMTIRIDQAVQANIDLGNDNSNHINLEGGGDLSFQYTPQGDMFLNGRYTFTSGTIKYSIPVIPLKEFNVQQGSYVQWTGNPMDPTLNLTATERVRASVTPAGSQSPRPVNFDVGIVLTQQLENIGLRFTLTAPEDPEMQEELTSKGPDEQGKLAVSMLVTGMYLGGGSGGKVNMNMGNALNSFLQSEINNIAGSALKSVDISFGVDTYDNSTDAGAGTRTDYSFRFAKRFYNDRIRVVLGGRISTGENVSTKQAQSFIDNVSVEYRLDKSGTRYVKLFYDKNYESLLEGEITEAGAGVVLRRKMIYLRELFNFKKAKVKPIVEEKEE